MSGHIASAIRNQGRMMVVGVQLAVFFSVVKSGPNSREKWHPPFGWVFLPQLTYVDSYSHTSPGGLSVVILDPIKLKTEMNHSRDPVLDDTQTR